jgi:hypothetical protein
VTTPKDVSIIADDAVKPLSTTAATVRDALIEAGIRSTATTASRPPGTTPLDRPHGHPRHAHQHRGRTTETVAVPSRPSAARTPTCSRARPRPLQAGKAGVVRRDRRDGLRRPGASEAHRAVQHHRHRPR